MHDTDTIIQNITGSKDYVKELEKVTGNIETIDKVWFRDINNANENDDREIRKILNRISSKCENFTLTKEFFAESFMFFCSKENLPAIVNKALNYTVKNAGIQLNDTQAKLPDPTSTTDQATA